eukprot:g14404.t1
MDLSFGSIDSKGARPQRQAYRQRPSQSTSSTVNSFLFLLQKAIRISSKANVRLSKLLQERNTATLNRAAIANALILERLIECNETKNVRRNVKPVKMIIVQLIPVLKALLSLAVDYSQYRLNYYNQFLDRYYLSDLCNLEERLLRGLNIIGDESNEPAADLPFSAKVSISNVLTELWFTKYFGFNLSQVRRENFIDAFEMEYGKQPAPNMAKLWSILQMIERKKIKTYECDKVSLMRRHNSNTDILDDCMQSDLANNFLLKTSNLSTSNRNSASDDEDDVSYKSSPKLYTGDTVEASTLDIFAGPNVVGNSLFTRYQEITSPDTNVYILGAIDESNLNAGSNMNDSPRSNGRSNVGNSHQRDDLLSGRNYNGTKEDSLFMFNLKYIPFSQMQVKQISCGGQHASALTEALQVYTWGRGTFGRLGHGNTARIKQPKLIESLTNAKIVKIACGFAYSACVSADGELYTWGAGENGRLGNGSTEDVYRPTIVPRLSKAYVTGVFAGSVHTCIVTKQGWIYSCGKFEYAGHNTSEDVLFPKRINKLQSKHIIQVGVGPGGYHTIALCRDGSVYTWGHNRVGQLGRPLVVCDERSEGVKEDDYTSGWENHPEAYSSDSGRDASNGQLDRRSVRRNSRIGRINAEGASYSPIPALVRSLQGLDIVNVVAGWGHSAVVTRDGDIYICGRHVKGQLGLGDPKIFPQNERGHAFCPDFRKIESLRGKPAASISCGGEHTAILCRNGDIYTVGSGEAGQLGHGKDVRDCHVPKLLKFTRNHNMKGINITCGNVCTILLVSNMTPKSLFHTCIDTINADSSLRNEVYANQQNIGENIIRVMEQRFPEANYNEKYIHQYGDDRSNADDNNAKAQKK